MFSIILYVFVINTVHNETYVVKLDIECHYPAYITRVLRKDSEKLKRYRVTNFSVDAHTFKKVVWKKKSIIT